MVKKDIKQRKIKMSKSLNCNYRIVIASGEKIVPNVDCGGEILVLGMMQSYKLSALTYMKVNSYFNKTKKTLK